MSALPVAEPELLMTEAEYLLFEDAVDTKHECVDGHVYDWPGYAFDDQGLAGATRTHNRPQGSLLAALIPVARAAGCEAYGSDMRLRIRLQRRGGCAGLPGGPSAAAARRTPLARCGEMIRIADWQPCPARDGLPAAEGQAGWRPQEGLSRGA
jgi:hypothetical protein